MTPPRLPHPPPPFPSPSFSSFSSSSPPGKSQGGHCNDGNRLKTEGQSQHLGHVRLGSLPSHPWGQGVVEPWSCRTTHRAHASLAHGPGRESWLASRKEVKRKRQGGQSGNYISCEAAGWSLRPPGNPKPAPNLTAAATFALVALSLCVCMVHLPSDSSHLSSRAGAQQSLGRMKLVERR